MGNWAYLATDTVVVDLEFRCAACGFSSPVKAEGKGAGYQGGVGSRHDAGAEEGVRAQALAGARRWAEIFVEFCPCPKCGQRDTKAAAYRKKSLLVTSVCAGMVGAGALLAALSIWGGAVPLVLIGLIGGIVAPLMMVSTLGSAKRKVHFPAD